MQDTAFQNRQRTQACLVWDTRNTFSCPFAIYLAKGWLPQGEYTLPHQKQYVCRCVERCLRRISLKVTGIKTDRRINYYYCPAYSDVPTGVSNRRVPVLKLGGRCRQISHDKTWTTTHTRKSTSLGLFSHSSVNRIAGLSNRPLEL